MTLTATAQSRLEALEATLGPPANAEEAVARADLREALGLPRASSVDRATLDVTVKLQVPGLDGKVEISGPEAELVGKRAGEFLHGQARERARREQWGTIGAESMERLAAMFPELVHLKAPIKPWDQTKLNAWARKCHSKAARYAVQFLLEVVWNGNKWSCGRFNMREAWSHWDEEHRAAVLAWLEAPFWP